MRLLLLAAAAVAAGVARLASRRLACVCSSWRRGGVIRAVMRGRFAVYDAVASAEVTAANADLPGWKGCQCRRFLSLSALQIERH